jgi:hypothetical protein
MKNYIYNTPTTNPPALIPEGAAGDAAVDLGALVPGVRYWVTLQNALTADRGVLFPDYQEELDGWIKTGAAADVGVELGTPIMVNYPVEVVPIAGKTRLSFIRNPDLRCACKVFVVRIDS